MLPWTTEPDNRFKDEDCTIINWSGHYLTLPCDDQNGYVCERHVPGYKGAADRRSYTWTNVLICTIIIVINGLF
ncbi:hypothetical protein CHS0354_014679 [Potamilus streckersoni]|uniref:Uncharacterized protein n=1 Tax=Potamilus streckersoni TaxID=2493646 RepID=A0AAE0SQB2_9BIVA|nr:hypothetical protein CHS0354_014679 [Potamilus streckersoni]